MLSPEDIAASPLVNACCDEISLHRHPDWHHPCNFGLWTEESESTILKSPARQVAARDGCDLFILIRIHCASRNRLYVLVSIPRGAAMPRLAASVADHLVREQLASFLVVRVFTTFDAAFSLPEQ
jgi:hypothetical protein